MISPVNKTGENPDYQSKIYYDDFYCGWDIWHGVIPMLTLLQPEATAGMVQTLIDLAENVGWMPDCRMSVQGWTQGGSNANNILGDFLLKLGETYGGIDWKKGWNALMKDVYQVCYLPLLLRRIEWWLNKTIYSFSNHLMKCGSVKVVEMSISIINTGTLHRTQIRVGIVRATRNDQPHELSNMLSMTLWLVLLQGVCYTQHSCTLYSEFVFIIRSTALGKEEEFKTFVNRSSNWKNLWNPDIEDSGHQGFIQPKYQVNNDFGKVVSFRDNLLM